MSSISRLGEDVSLVGTNPSVRVSSAQVRAPIMEVMIRYQSLLNWLIHDFL